MCSVGSIFLALLIYMWKIYLNCIHKCTYTGLSQHCRVVIHAILEFCFPLWSKAWLQHFFILCIANIKNPYFSKSKLQTYAADFCSPISEFPGNSGILHWTFPHQSSGHPLLLTNISSILGIYYQKNEGRNLRCRFLFSRFRVSRWSRDSS